MGRFKPLEPGSIHNRITILFNYIGKSRNRLMSRCVCECGELFNSYTRNIRNGITKSCGCLQAERTIEATREYYRNFRAERGLDPDIPMVSLEWKERVLFSETTARDVKIRDKYTCCLCGHKGRKMDAHHLKPWASDKENRFNPKNIVTLCKPCHLHRVHLGNTRNDPDSEITKVLIEKLAEMYK